MSPDLINGTFEAAGAGFTLLNVSRLVKDRRLNGVHWLPTCFFTAWGVWNLFYYPSLGQWYSFLGGCLIVLANTAWISLVGLFAIKNRRKPVSAAQEGTEPYGCRAPC